MIIYVCKRDHTYTLNEEYLNYWRPDLRKIIRIDTYEALFQAKRLPLCTYIFSDIERLEPAEQEAAAALYAILEAHDPEGLRLNHPLTSKRRFGLLHSLSQAGLNDFGVYRAGDDPRPAQFPVFVRGDQDHDGPVSPLLYDQAALEAWLAEFVSQGRSLDRYVVIEFLETRKDGQTFVKYGAYCVNGNIVPQHVLFSSEWVVKFGDGRETAADRVAFEFDYAQKQPHQDQIQAIFERANIGYGRIDYAVIEDKVQTFEINTNPSVVPFGEIENDPRSPNRLQFVQALTEAFLAIDAPLRGYAAVTPSDKPVYNAVREVYRTYGRKVGWFTARDIVRNFVRREPDALAAGETQKPMQPSLTR